MHSHGGNGGPGILPAVTLLEKGSHLSRQDLKVLVVFPTRSLGPRFLEESLTLITDSLCKNK